MSVPRDRRQLSLERPTLSQGVGIGLGIVALAAIGELWLGGSAMWDELVPGPGIFPLILAAILLVLSALLATGRTRAVEETEDASDYVSPVSTIKYALLAAALVLLFEPLGGLLSLGLFVTAELVWVERRAIGSSLLAGAVTTGSVYVIFVWILAVPVPLGILTMLD